MQGHRKPTHIYLRIISAPVGAKNKTFFVCLVKICCVGLTKVVGWSKDQASASHGWRYGRSRRYEVTKAGKKTLLPYFLNKLIRFGSFEYKISTKVLGIVVCYLNGLCNGTESQHTFTCASFMCQWEKCKVTNKGKKCKVTNKGKKAKVQGYQQWQESIKFINLYI
jgi:hypothetical protein